jgi:hypothetical protein
MTKLQNLSQEINKRKYACTDCNGYGYNLCSHAGGYVPTDIETGEELSLCTKECDKLEGDCTTCKGDGYVIPLEEGCEVVVGGRKHTFIGYCRNETYCTLGSKAGRNDYHDGQMIKIETVLYENISENLGKPPTLQDILLVLETIYDESGVLSSGEMFTVSYGKQNPSITLDLTKEPKEWDDKTIEAVIKLIK